MYELVCEEYEERPRAHTQFLNYLKNLEKEVQRNNKIRNAKSGFAPFIIV